MSEESGLNPKKILAAGILIGLAVAAAWYGLRQEAGDTIDPSSGRCDSFVGVFLDQQGYCMCNTGEACAPLGSESPGE